VENKGKWKEVLESKYGSWRNLNDFKITNNESLWWKDLRSVYGSMKHNDWFERTVMWRVGEGNKIRFWEDKWVGGTSLISTFLRLYEISNCKGSTVGELGGWTHNEWVQNITWRRTRLEWEKEIQEHDLM